MNTLIENEADRASQETLKDEEVEQKDESLMSKVLNASATPPSVDDVIEGTVLGIEKSAVYIDIPPFGTGIIYGREFNNARDLIKKMNPGDTVSAKIVGTNHKDGYIELSLKEARQALIWDEAEKAIKEKKIFELVSKEANKGGIILEWQGLQGFLPASQLKTEHYPRIDDGDKNKILDELRKLTGTKLSVSIIAAVPKENKLIFSEKTLEQEDKEKIIEKYTVGEITEGTVTGVVDFGIFVKLEEGLEGLVHISEMDWALVDNPRSRFKTGDVVKVKVIEVKGGKVSLSIKALKPNPWLEAANKYHKDDVVKAVIIKFNKHGALGSIEEGVAGLVHISEFGSEEKLRTTLELGKTYDFKITLFEPKEQRMTLSYVAK